MTESCPSRRRSASWGWRLRASAGRAVARAPEPALEPSNKRERSRGRSSFFGGCSGGMRSQCARKYSDPARRRAGAARRLRAARERTLCLVAGPLGQASEISLELFGQDAHRWFSNHLAVAAGDNANIDAGRRESCPSEARAARIVNLRRSEHDGAARIDPRAIAQMRPIVRLGHRSEFAQMRQA